LSTRQVFSILAALAGILGILGASGLDMTRGPNLGPGAAPMVYSIVLTFLAFRLFLAGRDQGAIRWGSLLRPPARDGLVFYAFVALILPLSVIFGTMTAIFIFSFSSLMYLKRMSAARNIVFSLFMVIAFECIFAGILGIPFENGFLFGPR